MSFGWYLLLILVFAVTFEFTLFVRREYRTHKRLRDQEKQIRDIRRKLTEKQFSGVHERAYRHNIERGGGLDYEDRIDNGPINPPNEQSREDTESEDP